MKIIFKVILSYLLIIFNSYVSADSNSNNNILKIGVLAPLSGELELIGKTILYSTNLALHDIGDKKIKIYPVNYDSNKNKISKACEKFRDKEVKIVIGPIESKSLKKLDVCNDLIFLSLSNMSTNTQSNNIITMGINLESQLLAIKDFIEKNKKKKTVILYPDNEYTKHVEKNIKLINFKNSRTFKYSKDPEILTSQIEKLTNYKRRKINLEARIKKIENSDDPKDIREVNELKQRYTLGDVNFDSVIIVDFGNGLKSVLTSLAYTDVLEDKILIMSANQWFDKSILEESSIKKFYFPSINLKNFIKFKEKFFNTYDYEANEIAILAYDAFGLIYYFWKNDLKMDTAISLNLKKEIKGKIGKFKIANNKVIQKLDIYKFEEGKFILSKL